MSVPHAVVLAGGQARRMGGGDKCLLPLNQRPLLAHILDRLGDQVAGSVLNANGDPQRFAGFDLPVVPDSIAAFPGPLAGVLAGLDWAAEHGAGWVVSVAGDTPFFPETLVADLMEARGTAPIVLAATPHPTRGNQRHPTFGLWSTALRDDLRTALQGGLRKVVDWTDQHGAATAVFPAHDGDPFFNINTPDDLAEAQARIR